MMTTIGSMVSVNAYVVEVVDTLSTSRPRPIRGSEYAAVPITVSCSESLRD